MWWKLMEAANCAGHSDAVRALAVANERLFSGSYDGTVKVWDVRTMECLQTLAGHTGPVRTLVYSGGHMFSGSYDKTVSYEFSQCRQCSLSVASCQRFACCLPWQGPCPFYCSAMHGNHMFSGSYDKKVSHQCCHKSSPESRTCALPLNLQWYMFSGFYYKPVSHMFSRRP